MQQKRSLLQVTLRGTFWTYLTYYSGKGMVFVSTVILARLLSQQDFGVAGYALVVINFLDVLSDLGIAQAVIYYRNEPDAAETAFWLGLGVGIALFAGTWLLAPLAAAFFNDPRAIPVIRVLALTYPLSALSNVHSALLQKGLNFKQKFWPDLLRMTSKGLLSIIFALLGFGWWSLILGQVGGTAISVFAYWRAFPWRPSFRFVRSLARTFLTYGLHIVAVGALGTLLTNSDYLLVGRFLGATALGVYSVAFRIPELLIMQFCNVIAVVIFPVYARMQEENPGMLRQGFLATTQYVAMVTVPLGLGLALVARPFVLTVFTARWAEAIPVMQAISIYALFYSLAYNAGDVYKAQGRPGLLTRLALVRAVVLLPALWWAATGGGGIATIAWVHAAVALASGTLNLIVAGRMLQVPVQALLRALRPAAIGGVALVLSVLATLALTRDLIPLAQLVAAVAVGGASYLGFLWWLQRDVVRTASQTLRLALSQR